MMLAFLIPIGDVETMSASTKTLTYPFIEVFSQATKSAARSTVMACIIVVMGVCGIIGALTSASRM